MRGDLNWSGDVRPFGSQIAAPDSCGFRGPGRDQRIVFSLDQGHRGSIYSEQIVTPKEA